MSVSKMKTSSSEVTTLKESLAEIPIDMRDFSLAMRSLYSDKAVGTTTDAARKFRALRDDTRQDAVVFLKCILPISTKFVMSIKAYFEYYEALTYEEWCDMLADILEETTTYKEVAQAVVGMYESIMVPLKKREDEAKLLITEFKDLQVEFERQRKALESAANSKRKWSAFLAFVPFVNVIATPILEAQADSDLAKAVAAAQQSKVNEAATIVVAHTLIPALSNFINGLTKAAGFFQVMEHELELFGEKAEKGVASPKRLHYKVMSKEAKEIQSLCQGFYAILPAVRTDFEAIPAEGTDQNYVDKWLEKTLDEIQKKRKSTFEFIRDGFKKALQ
ncbi:uncharacterized protein LOC114535913 [Dendronephthya gigantea]|uniref:uncharacterized protein LOC114535913 n=1 Tax=Dendronephthya gigantea TaxID=151771 RepID=UPI00106AE930|nr:uncharacterized protein LOC114535913 [Dendronephthya gigantea]